MTTKATARNHKANHKAKANGKAHAKPAPKPVQTTAILGVANTDIQTMSRKVLNSLCVKHMGAEPNPMIGDAPLRVFLTNLNNGMPRQEATAGLKKWWTRARWRASRTPTLLPLLLRRPR